jgi:gluconate 2-dehydrogenase alpha chain
MARRARPVDAVIIGCGWTGAIMAKTLTDAGLSVVALERGPARDTSPDFEYPRIVDELKHALRGELWQPLAKETVTVRHGTSDVAVPYRRYGSFVLGNGVGGAGVHWNGQLWRASPEDLRLRSRLEERYGKNVIPEDQRVIDEFNSDHFDHGGLGFVGGSLIYAGATGGRPIDQMLLPPDAPQWGTGWKSAIRKHYRHSAARNARFGHVLPRQLPVARPRL